jgi:hypothetical protein
MSAGSPNGILYLNSFGFHRLVCNAMQYISVLCSIRNGTKSQWLPGQFFNLITAILRKSENPNWFFLCHSQITMKKQQTEETHGSFQVLSQKSQSLWVFETGCFLIQNSFFEKNQNWSLNSKNWNYGLLLRKIKCPLHHFGLYYKPHYPILTCISQSAKTAKEQQVTIVVGQDWIVLAFCGEPIWFSLFMHTNCHCLLLIELELGLMGFLCHMERLGFGTESWMVHSKLKTEMPLHNAFTN